MPIYFIIYFFLKVLNFNERKLKTLFCSEFKIKNKNFKLKLAMIQYEFTILYRFEILLRVSIREPQEFHGITFIQ